MMVAVKGIIWGGYDICAGAVARGVKEPALEDWDGEGGGEMKESGEEHCW